LVGEKKQSEAARYYSRSNIQARKRYVCYTFATVALVETAAYVRAGAVVTNVRTVLRASRGIRVA